MSHKPTPKGHHGQNASELPIVPPYGSRIDKIAKEERKLADLVLLNGGQKKPAGPQRKKKSKKGKPQARPQPGSLLHPIVQQYLSDLTRPDRDVVGKVPFNPLQVPTNNSFTYRAYNTITLNGLATGVATEISFFPGHTMNADAEPLDLVSAHALTQRLAGPIDWVVGPAGDGTRNPCVGFYQTGVASGTFLATTAAATAITSAEVAPFTVADGDGDHTRWRLQSMQVTIENVTPQGSLGGDVIVVQPDHSTSDTAAGAYMKFSSYRRYNALEPIVVKWIPRTRDFYWWHSVNAINTNPSEAGVRILIDNSTGVAQNYKVMWIMNFEVSGAKYAQLSTPTLDNFQASAVLPRAVNAARNHSGNLTSIKAHAEVEAASMLGHPAAQELGARLRAMGADGVEAVKKHVASAIGGALGLGAATVV